MVVSVLLQILVLFSACVLAGTGVWTEFVAKHPLDGWLYEVHAAAAIVLASAFTLLALGMAAGKRTRLGQTFFWGAVIVAIVMITSGVLRLSPQFDPEVQSLALYAHRFGTRFLLLGAVAFGIVVSAGRGRSRARE